MTALGQTRTSADVCGTTASPSEADIPGSPSDVAEVPGTDILCRSMSAWTAPNSGANIISLELRARTSDATLQLGSPFYPMASPNAHDPPGAGASLKGLRILVVEDSWNVGMALKSLLRAWGADVAGPVATTAEAERLLLEYTPDVAIVDIHLRGGELAYGLIDRLHDQRISVVVISGYSNLPPGSAALFMQKPIVEEQLLAHLRPMAVEK